MSFKEVPKENIEIELNELKNKLLTEELANIKLYIEKKDYINTKTSSDLIDSLGGRMDKVTEEKLVALKTYYTKERPVLIKKTLQKANKYYEKIMQKTVDKISNEEYR